MSVNRKITRGILGGSFLTLVSIAIALLQYRLIFHYMPNELVGVWFLFVTLSGYATFFDLGLGPTLSREIAFIIGNASVDHERKQVATADLIATCGRIYLFLAGTVLLVALCAGSLYVRSVAPERYLDEVQLAWLVFAVGAALNILGAMNFAELYGRGNVATERLTRALTQIAGFAMALGALAAGFGLIGLACAWLLQCALARTAAYVRLRQYRVQGTPVGRFDKAIARRVAGPSLRWAGTALGGVLILQTDNIIIASVLGPGAIAHYEPVAKIVATLMTFSMLIVTSSTPFLSQHYAANNREAFRTQLYRNVRFSMAIMITCVSFLCFYGEKIITLWLGAGAFIGFPVIWMFAAMIILECHHANLATAAMSTGKQFFAFIALLAGILNIVISWNLAKSHGLIGVAAGTMIAQMLTNNWYVPYVSLKVLEIPFSDYFKKTLLPLSGLLATGLLTNAMTSRYLDSLSNFGALVMGFAISALACGAWFSLRVLTPAELSYVSQRFSRKSRANTNSIDLP